MAPGQLADLGRRDQAGMNPTVKVRAPVAVPATRRRAASAADSRARASSRKAWPAGLSRAPGLSRSNSGALRSRSSAADLAVQHGLGDVRRLGRSG